MKTLIAINNLTSIDQLAYSNHMQFFFRLGVAKGRANVQNPNEPYEFAICNPRRMSIDRMRNEAAKIAMEGDFDYIFFIDDDVLLPLNAFEMLYRADKDIIAGVTHIRGYPFYPMIFNFTEEYKNNSYVVDYKEKGALEPDGIIECSAVGFSCCLIKVDLLKKLIPPFFITSTHQTEDVYFCKKVKDTYPEQKIYAHTLLHTGHILGSDIIAPENIEVWKKFEEERYPELLKAEEKKGRKDRESSALEEIVKSI